MEPWTIDTAIVRLQRVADGPTVTPTMHLGEAGAALIFFGILMSTLLGRSKSS
jgi:hypothetical protein